MVVKLLGVRQGMVETVLGFCMSAWFGLYKHTEEGKWPRKECVGDRIVWQVAKHKGRIGIRWMCECKNKRLLKHNILRMGLVLIHHFKHLPGFCEDLGSWGAFSTWSLKSRANLVIYEES